MKGNEGLILSRILTYALKKINGWKRKLPFGIVPFLGDMLIFLGLPLLKLEF